ncbi:hypothetical protein ACS0TY_031935 [Phlomoides rotata]
MEENLRKRGIIQGNGDIICLLYGEEEENLNHIFFECNFANRIWWNIYQWIGISTASQQSPIEPFLQHNDMYEVLGLPYGLARFGTIPNSDKVMDEIKARTWSWIVAKKKGASLIPYGQWRKKSAELH